MSKSRLLSLEEQYGDMAEVEVYEMFRFCLGSVLSLIPRLIVLTVRHETAKVPTNDAMPCCTLLRVELGHQSAHLLRGIV